MTHHKSFRSFADELVSAGLLKSVPSEVDKSWEIACIARWVTESLSESDRYALQFNNVAGHRDPVIVGLFSTHDLYARALGVARHEVLPRWAAAMENPQPPTVVDAAPVLERVTVREQCDLSRLPAPVWTPGHDGGPYLSAAGVITKDRDSGVQNLGVYRVQIHDQHTAGLFFGSEKQHGAIHFAKYRDANEPMPVALVLGASPSVSFAAAAKTRYGVDELDIAGGLGGEPVRVIRGQTVDLFVPAEAEYIIEGFVHPSDRSMEGPFGEGLGFVNAAAPAPVITVSAICRRERPLFHGYVQQLPPTEGHLVWEYGTLGPTWYYLREQLGFEVLSDLAIVPGAAGLSMLAVQVRDPDRKDVAKLWETLRSVNFGQKFIVVVDDDVDIRDPETLNWAISTRADPERDTRIVGDVKTYLLDPSTMARNGVESEHASGPFEASMMLIDATLKCRSPAIALPGERPMLDVLRRWDEYALPPIRPRARLERLLTSLSRSNPGEDAVTDRNGSEPT